MIKIVSFKICPFVQRVTALLETKNIPYNIEFITLSDKPQWFLDIAPNGQVPLLITDSGTALFESDAIVEYIDEIQAPLEADISAEQRAINRAWSYQATKHYLIQCAAMRSADESTLLQRADKLGEVFEKISNELGDGPFFGGSKISNVDIAWVTILHRADIIRRYTGYDFLSGYPKVQAWQKELMKTDIPEKSVSPDFEEAFTSFYLSENTFLGTGKSCDAILDKQYNTGTCC